MPDFTYDVLVAYARADTACVHKVLLLHLEGELFLSEPSIMKRAQ